MQDIAGAIARLEAALARGGGEAVGYLELARLKLAAGDPEGAVAAYRQCAACAAPSSGLYNNLGAALIKARRFGEAITALESALALQPAYHRALTNLGKALREAGRLSEAVDRLHQALAIMPDHVPALVNLGDAHAAAGDLGAAHDALERAIRLAPGLPEAHTALGMVLLHAGRGTESLAALHTAVALKPDHAEAHANLGHALFVGGDWSAAWPHFEHRFRRQALRAGQGPPAGVARWNGTAILDSELWLIGEQGLGDQLQFARYASLLVERGIHCVIACDPKLVKLLSLARLGARIVPFGMRVDDPAARWVALMSLPAWHRTRPNTVPGAAGYLVADPERIERWQALLPASADLRVALAWAGNPAMETGRYLGRSPPLAALVPLMTVPGVRFVSLQKGPGEDQLSAAAFGGSIMRLPRLDDGPDAFLDSAAVLKCVDLLVTSDTAIAHLAGALGVPTWLCLMHEPDWRWMLSGTTTPWYHSMRLFRQPARADWGSVYAAIADELALLAARRR